MARIPEGLRELVSEFSGEVIRKQPENIPLFLADYIDAKLARLGEAAGSGRTGTSGPNDAAGDKSYPLDSEDKSGKNPLCSDADAKAGLCDPSQNDGKIAPGQNVGFGADASVGPTGSERITERGESTRESDREDDLTSTANSELAEMNDASAGPNSASRTITSNIGESAGDTGSSLTSMGNFPGGPGFGPPEEMSKIGVAGSLAGSSAGISGITPSTAQVAQSSTGVSAVSGSSVSVAGTSGVESSQVPEGGHAMGSLQNVPGGDPNIPPRNIQSTPGGLQNGQSIPGSSTQNIPGSTQDIPGASTQNIPGSSAQTIPGSSAQNIPGSSAQNMAGSSAQNIPGSSAQNMAGNVGGIAGNDQNVPSSAQNMSGGVHNVSGNPNGAGAKFGAGAITGAVSENLNVLFQGNPISSQGLMGAEVVKVATISAGNVARAAKSAESLVAALASAKQLLKALKSGNLHELIVQSLKTAQRVKSTAESLAGAANELRGAGEQILRNLGISQHVLGGSDGRAGLANDWTQAVTQFLDSQADTVRKLLNGEISVGDASGTVTGLAVALVVGVSLGYAVARSAGILGSCVPRNPGASTTLFRESNIPNVGICAVPPPTPKTMPSKCGCLP